MSSSFGREEPARLQGRPDGDNGRGARPVRSLNPEKIPGRLTLITRQGADNVRENLPPLLAAVRNSGHPVVWACDPMHGNTYTAEGGHKTRHFDRILDEIAGFFAAHRQEEPGRAASTSNSPATPSRSASVAATTSRRLRSTRRTRRCAIRV